ncbi:MAG: hypothetical protein ACFE8E_04995 [Candidatus Hodarchaeota archaeon]
MSILGIFETILLYIFQADLSPEQESFIFIVVIFGIILLIIILIYILVTSRKE